MIALLFSPIARWLGGALLIGAILASIYAKGRIDGKAHAVAKIEAANERSMSKADAAERDVLACPVGKWNKEIGTCANSGSARSDTP